MRKHFLYANVKTFVKVRKQVVYAFFTASLRVRKFTISCCELAIMGLYDKYVCGFKYVSISLNATSDRNNFLLPKTFFFFKQKLFRPRRAYMTQSKTYLGNHSRNLFRITLRTPL